MTWRAEWSDHARRDARRFDRQVKDRIAAALDRYIATGQGDVIRLTDVAPPEYRLRVGDWRIRFARDPSARVIYILRVSARDKAY